MSRWTRELLRGGRVFWLLELTVGGREFLFGEVPCEIEDARGRVRVYAEGLGSLRKGVASEGTPERAIGITLQPGDAWLDLIRSRRGIERAPGRLLRWVAGTSYEMARVVLAGVVEGFEHGDRFEAVRFSVVRTLIGDARPLPGPRLVVDATTWPARSGWSADTEAYGVGYPLVIGRPGSVDTWASPGIVVETDHASLTTDRVLVMAAPPSATAVLLTDYTDELAPETVSTAIVVATDATGQRVGVVEPNADLTVPVAAGRKYSVAWTTGGGVVNPQTGSELRGAGDVLQWLVTTWTAQPWDALSFSASRDALNAYLIDTYVDEQIDPHELLSSIASMLPCDPQQGPGGLFYKVRRLEVRPEEAVVHLDAQQLGIQREGPVETKSDEIVNEVAVSFGAAGASTRWTQRVIVTGADRARDLGGGADPRIQPSYRATLSQAVYGLRAETIDLPHTWDATTATRVALDAIAQRALPRRYVQYSAGPEFEFLEPGDVILLTDTDLEIRGEVAVVLDVEVGGPDVAIDLMLLDDPALSRPVQRPARPAPEPLAFSPLDIPDCLSWWDCLDATQLTLGGSGGAQLVGLADKGPAGVDLAAFSAPTTGIPMGTWEIAGLTEVLPGPLTGGSPRSVLEGATTFGIGDLTIVALIPLGSVTGDAHYWSYSHGTIPVVRVALTASVSPSGRIRLLLGSGIGTSIQAADLQLDGANGPAAHALVVATLDAGTGTVTLDCWYDRDTGAGIQHPAAVTSSGYVGTAAQFATLGGRRNTTDQWSGADARLHTVLTYDRVLSAPEIEALRGWAYDRLGWPL